MSHVVVLHRQPGPPFAPVAELLTAANVDRVFAMALPTRLVFNMAGNDASLLGLGEGSVLSDHGPNGLPSWLWRIRRISDTITEGTVELECDDYSSVLFERIVPASVVSSSRVAPAVGMALLTATGGRNPHHIRPMPVLAGGRRRILRGDVSLSGGTVGDALNQLAQLTNSEWWVDYDVRWSRAQMALRWTGRRGLDRRNDVQLDEFAQLQHAEYSRDSSDLSQTVVQVGASASAGAPTAATVVGSQLATFRPAFGGRSEASDEALVRYKRQRSILPQRRERSSVSPAETDELSLSAATKRLLELPRTAAQQVTLAVSADYDWSSFFLGDTIVVRLTAFGGLDLDVRVKALQPDEASGVMEMIVEVLP